MINIEWKRLIYHNEDIGDFYLISNSGQIMGVKTGKIRSKNVNHEGYYFVGVSLGSRNEKRCIKIHRAVAESFIENPYNYPVINHKDGDKLNNNVENLEWCTYQYNTIHAINMGLLKFDSIKVVCLNTGEVFDDVHNAASWCGLKSSRSIMDNINGKAGYAGRHPNTNEFLRWGKDLDNKSVSSSNSSRPKILHKEKIICITTGQVFNSANEAGVFYNLKSIGHISSCCRGKEMSYGKDNKSGKRLKWMYYADWLKNQSNNSNTTLLFGEIIKRKRVKYYFTNK